jgi:O-glycosyl hydrolase
MRLFFYTAFVAIILLTLTFCGTNASGEIEGTIKININTMHQEIDGFGGSNAWTRLPENPQVASELVKLLFSRTEGMGFTILRNRIPFRERLSTDDTPSHNDGFLVRRSDNTYAYTENADGVKTFELNWNSWDISSTRNLIRQIHNLGSCGPEELTIMSSPWTPPNNRVTRWKEDVVGVSARLDYTMDWSRPDVWGRLRRAHYNDYADLLADYVLNFESRMGAPLAILSVQNEPNWKVEYESAYWSGIDLRDFIKVIAQRFPMKGLTAGSNGIGIMMPEFENFNINFDEMIKPSLDDPLSESVITHIALHQYNGAFDSSSRAGARAFPQIIESGKRFWQTEVSGSGPHLPEGTGINNALYYARMIHWDMTLAQTNAFLFWWLWTNDPTNTTGSLVIVDGNRIIPAHRLYAMGQYSRFIRPGWFRIDCETSPLWGVYSSAYKNPETNEIAIVVINEKIITTTVSIDLEGAVFDRINVWRTSENELLKPIGRQRTANDGFKATLAPMSITTFYGTVR